MKRSFFGINFNPKNQPGFEARYHSEAERLTGGACMYGEPRQPVNWGVSESQATSRAVPIFKFLNSGTVDQTLPSRILRKKGVMP